VLSASRHTLTAASPPMTMTGVPSGNAPTATACTAPPWPRSGSPTEVVGTLHVHGGGGPRRGASCGIEVGYQPGRIDGDSDTRSTHLATRHPSGR
jgi:hypothetical protein